MSDSKVVSHNALVGADGKHIYCGSRFYTRRDGMAWVLLAIDHDNEGHEVVARLTGKKKLRGLRPEWCVRNPPEWVGADGKPLRVGDDVDVRDIVHKKPVRGTIVGVSTRYGKEPLFVVQLDGFFGTSHFYCGALYHHKLEVLAADGLPIEVGQTVYDKRGREHKVEDFDTVDGTTTVICRHRGAGTTLWFKPQNLAHERPDSWERLEEDARKDFDDYWGCSHVMGCNKCPATVDGEDPMQRFDMGNCREAMRLDIVRRAKALAGVGGDV